IKAQERLVQIADISRELVDSMSDIVWAIHPGRDRIGDLTARMRHLAANVFTARDIKFEFRAPAPAGVLKLDADARRQVFLIFKEAVNNIVRHANCSQVEIDFAIDRERLVLTLRNNGRGIGPQSGTEGHGLANMRRRAEALGGTVA